MSIKNDQGVPQKVDFFKQDAWKGEKVKKRWNFFAPPVAINGEKGDSMHLE